MSLSNQSEVEMLSDIIKDICLELKCFKKSYDNVVTRCIYCGDSVKRTSNHGHFYIWSQIPICYCFRCGHKVKVTKWLYDLKSMFDNDKIDNTIEQVKKVYGQSLSYSSSLLFGNDKIRNIDISKLEFDPQREDIVNLLMSRNLYDTELCNLIKYDMINVSLYKMVDNDTTFLGVKSLYQSGYHLRDINSLKVSQIKNLPFDIFIVGSNFLAPTVYVVEGLFDALALIKLNNYFKIDLNSYCIIISNVGSHLRNLYYYLQINDAKKIVMIYDNDVDTRILTNHKRTSKWVLGNPTCSRISFSSTKVYKDINEIVINAPLSNWTDYLVSV